ncbi:Notchless protein-like [Spatholobus suberectus]|nr:Notchless protein-like [Spatholobus suberectus]
MQEFRAKNGSTESANNGSPRFPIEGDIAKPGGRLHVGDAGSAAAAGANPRRRLAPPHLPPLVHQKTEAHHLAGVVLARGGVEIDVRPIFRWLMCDNYSSVGDENSGGDNDTSGNDGNRGCNSGSNNGGGNGNDDSGDGDSDNGGDGEDDNGSDSNNNDDNNSGSNDNGNGGSDNSSSGGGNNGGDADDNSSGGQIGKLRSKMEKLEAALYGPNCCTDLKSRPRSKHVLRIGAFDHTGKQYSSPEEMKVALERYKAMRGNAPERLASGSDDFTMFLWEPFINKHLKTRRTGHQQLVNHVYFSPDGQWIASASFDKSVKLRNGTIGKFVAAFRGHVGPVYIVSFPLYI